MENCTDEGQSQRRHAWCEAPLGDSHHSAGAIAADSLIIQWKAQKRKQQCALTCLTHTTESASLRRWWSKCSIYCGGLTLESWSHQPPLRESPWLFNFVKMNTTCFHYGWTILTASIDSLAQEKHCRGSYGKKAVYFILKWLSWQKPVEKVFWPTENSRNLNNICKNKTQMRTTYTGGLLKSFTLFTVAT